MRFALPPLTPVVRAILIVLFASFVAQTLCTAVFGLDVFSVLALRYELGPGLAWQWATYPLVELPSDRAVVSRAFDMMLVYFWVTRFEEQYGARRTWILAALSILGGALLVFPVGYFLSGVPFAGASAVAWAGLGALAVMTHGQSLNWVFLPQMNAWTLAIVFLVIEALEATWRQDPAPLLAAIAGLAVGVLYTRHIERPAGPKKKPPPKRKVGGPNLQ